MAALTITIEPDEFLGLSALVELEKVADHGEADVVSTAKTLTNRALAAKLEELGLPWAPSPETVQKRAAEAAEPGGALRTLMRNDRVKKCAISVLVVVALVALWGGYIRGWEWTGFRANKQLWDWLQLLLLPVVAGTIPLWIKHGDYISRARRVTYVVVIAAFMGLVAAGYLIPLKWTGFPGNTLWDWFGLILLPVAVASLGVLPSSVRSLRSYHKAGIVFIAAGWTVTIIGGYALRWTWTGYQGNTLWDWLQLLLLPLVVPTILLPTALRWVSGNAAQRAHDAREAARNSPARSRPPAYTSAEHLA
jgi:hypothetical protein